MGVSSLSTMMGGGLPPPTAVESMMVDGTLIPIPNEYHFFDYYPN